jgi:immune inhibitor A
MKKALSCILVLLMIFCSGFAQIGTEKKIDTIPHELAPMNRDAMIEKLTEEGKISPNATQEEVERALKDYIGNISVKKEVNKYSKMKEAVNEEKITKGMENSNALYNGNKVGQGKKLDKAEEVPYGNPVKTSKVLVLLVEFPDLEHNNIPRPDLTKQYWTSDFSLDHYRSLIFGDGEYTTPEGIKSSSMNEFFKDQSNGNFAINGDVYGWFTASKPAAYYGLDVDGERGNDQAPRELVEEVAKQAAASGVDLSKYDYEDPYDLDGDGNTDEPDGIVDHLMVLHAGVGQEDGGGILDTDAIWSHSWNLEEPTKVSADYSVYDYTIEPENGAVGVMAHEFVHDLGMPDDYDTQYTADGDITEYWTIMSSGSWCGRPAGTQPSGINPYSRILLGLIHGGNWINWGSVDINKSGTITTQLDTASMNTGNRQAILFKLPDQVVPVNKPIEGSSEFWGGTGAEADHSMILNVDLTGKTSASLTYNIWYDIEEDWDAGMIQVSEDNGTTWKSIKTPYTVNDFNNASAYPTILANLPAYTGKSDGWLSENIDLSSYAGKNIKLRFRYITDWGTQLDGMFVDNIKVIADGTQMAFENAENGFGNLANDGFVLSDGTKSGPHYYVAEWRSHLGVDEGLMHCAKANVAYNQGLLIWYKNTLYNDNWVGVHPGYGTLGVVDANQFVYLNDGLGNGNESGIRAGYMPFVQLHDAAFSLDKASDMNLSVYDWAKNPNLKAKQAEPVFDDSNSYFSTKSPYSGLHLPSYGLKIRVTGVADDYSRGEIVITK